MGIQTTDMQYRPFLLCALVPFLKVNDGLTTDGFSEPLPDSMIRVLN